MIVGLAAGLLLSQAAPAGPDFAATFTPAAVASHLDGKVAYLVVGAGPPTPALAAAAGALEEGLRRSGKAELVMNGSSLGPVADLDDPALVKKCQPLPVARVAVVRVFEIAGEPPRAVVAVYDMRATVQVAFTAQAGAPLAPGQMGSATAAQGVPSGVAQAVLQSGGGPAQEEYDKTYISFDDITALTPSGVRQWTWIRQGKDRRSLEGEEFYKIIGRDDLLARYHENERARTTVRLVGVGIAVGVPFIALATRSTKSCPPMSDPQWFDCNQEKDSADMRTALFAGGGAALGVLIAIVGGNAIELHPIGATEAHRLGDDYNKKLKSRLGLARAEPREPADETRPSSHETRIAVSLAPVRGGGMVGLAVSF